MFKAKQLRELIIKPALLDLVLYSQAAEELLMFTCAVESDGGTYLKQLIGPALGIYQMEPDTHNDLWQNFIKKQQSIMTILINSFDCIRMQSEDRLIYDLRYATAMTRLFYLRIPSELPAYNDIEGIWNYYKQHYNTAAGAADKTRCLNTYLSFIRA